MREVSTLRLLVGIGLTGGVLLAQRATLSPYTAWGLSLPVLVWCGGPFHDGMLRCFNTQRANTDMLISLSAWAAFLYSTLVVFEPFVLLSSGCGHLLGVMGGLIVFATFGRWIEIRLTKSSGEALGKIIRRIPHTARRLPENGCGSATENVPSESVRMGDRISVRPGEQIPIDGTVVEGASRVDESLWTGSEALVEKTVGSRVLSGTQNKGGTLTVVVDRSGTRSALARLVESVRSGFALKSVRSGIADGLAGVYVPGVVIAAAGTALLWSWKVPEPQLEYALTAMCFILIAACPWAVTIASPAALAFGLRRAGRMGIRIRNPGVLEKLDRADVLMLDKGGILTEGRPKVREVICFGDWQEKELLRRAMIAEKRSGHPFFEALLRRRKGMRLPDADSQESYPGRGVAVVYDGARILAGSPAWLAEQGVRLSERDQRLFQSKSDSLMAVAVAGELAGVITFEDAVLPGVAEAVRAIEGIGIEVILASGDRNPAAHRVAEQAGIRRVYSEVFEEDKVRIVEELQSQGKKVVMAGDGMRDAAALSRADLGISIGTSSKDLAWRRRPDLGAGIDLAAESSDVILIRRDLEHLMEALRLCLKIREAIRENLRWAFGVHIFMLPAAAGALFVHGGMRLLPLAFGAAAAASLTAVMIHSIRRFGEKYDDKEKAPKN